MGIDKVNVVEEGNYPYYPSGPSINRNIRLGAVGGAVVTALIISLIYLLNDTIKTGDDIEKYLGLTALGVIPLENTIKGNKTKHKRKQNRDKAA